MKAYKLQNVIIVKNDQKYINQYSPDMLISFVLIEHSSFI